jgi:hypothetical protein
VFVKALGHVEGTFQALYTAAAGGELVDTIEGVMKSKGAKGFESKRNAPKVVAGSLQVIFVVRNASINKELSNFTNSQALIQLLAQTRRPAVFAGLFAFGWLVCRGGLAPPEGFFAFKAGPLGGQTDIGQQATIKVVQRSAGLLAQFPTQHHNRKREHDSGQGRQGGLGGQGLVRHGKPHLVMVQSGLTVGIQYRTMI